MKYESKIKSNFVAFSEKLNFMYQLQLDFQKKKFQGKKRPQKSMTIGSPEILTKRKKEKKAENFCRTSFFKSSEKWIYTGFVTFHGTYNSLQVIFNEIHEFFYQLDQNCGVDA